MLRNLAIAFSVCLAVAACNDSPTTDPTAPASDPLGPQALVSLESNTWATLTKTRAPRARVAGAAIGNVIYLVGGWRFTSFNEGRGGWATSTLQAYDVGTDRWSARTPMPGGRYQVNGASVIDGRLYVSGGANNKEDLTKTLFVYDPATNSWTRKADMPRPGACGAQGVIARKLYVYIGCPGEGQEHQFFHYDPATDRWTTLSKPPSQHATPAAGVINGRFYLVGGAQSFSQPNLAVHVYDPVSRIWTSRASLPSEQTGAVAGVLNGKLYVAGGVKDFLATSTHRVYDPTTNTWTARAPMLTARSEAAGAVAGGRFFVLGGFGSDGPPFPVEENEAYTP
jgi:N-acetylneuraminic acid mutarotase